MHIVISDKVSSVLDNTGYARNFSTFKVRGKLKE
jgi:hypothetical protein